MSDKTMHCSFECNKQIVVMHICYLNPENQSGYETRVIEETSLLQRMGFRVIIACFIGTNHVYSRNRILKFHSRLKQSTGAKIYILPTNHYFDLRDSSLGTKTITLPLVALARLHSVNIMHGQALYSTMHALRARPHTKAKVVFDVHGASPEETEMSGGNASRVKHLQEWEKAALNEVDLRVFVSNRMQSFFKAKYELPDHPSVVVPCCVHNKRFRMREEDRLSKRAQMGITDRFVLLYLGTLSVWQWPEAMFSLFAQFHQEKPDSLLFLLLPQAEHDRAVSFLKRHNLPPTSYIIEEVPHSEVGSVIGVGDVSLLLRKAHPVNYVSSPTKFGEYLAAGVPVIATEDIGDISNIIKKEKVGLIISANDDCVNQKDLRPFLRFADEIMKSRNEWSNRCERVAEKFLNWNSHGEIMVDAYKNYCQMKGHCSIDKN